MLNWSVPAETLLFIPRRTNRVRREMEFALLETEEEETCCSGVAHDGADAQETPPCPCKELVWRQQGGASPHSVLRSITLMGQQFFWLFFFSCSYKKKSLSTPFCCFSVHLGIVVSEALLQMVSQLPSSFPPNSFSLQVQKMLLLIASSSGSSWDLESSWDCPDCYILCSSKKPLPQPGKQGLHGSYYCHAWVFHSLQCAVVATRAEQKKTPLF